MKKSIFLIINSLYGGGAEHVASHLSRLLSRDYSVYVISLCELSNEDYPFEGKIISIATTYKGIFWINKLRSAAHSIDQYAQCIKPEIMISFLQNANLCLMMTRYKAKKIVSVRNNLDAQYNGGKRLAMDFLVKHYFRKADYVVSVSKFLQKEMTNKYGIQDDKSVCIYNPYFIAQIRQKAEEPLDEATLLFYKSHQVISNVGHINAQKGQFHLIRILNYLRRKGHNVGVVIVGAETDNTLKKLYSLVKDYSLESHVLFTGRHNNPYKYIYNSQLFVFPSLFEGFPNALVEAMACGIPVISADCKSGPKEILIKESESYGILLDNDPFTMLDSSKKLTKKELCFALAIEDLLDNSNKRKELGMLAARRAQDFSEEVIYKQWKQLIESHVNY